MMAGKQQKKAEVIDVAIPSDSKIKKKEYEKLKEKMLKEGLWEMWEVKAVVPFGNECTCAVTFKLGKWLPETT